MKAKIEAEFEGDVDDIDTIARLVRHAKGKGHEERENVNPLLWRIKPSKRWRIGVR